MEHLHGGHPLALFGCLDAVGKTDPAGASQYGLEQHQAQSHPAGGEPVQIDSPAVKQVKEAVVGLWPEVQNADITCDAGPVRTATEAHQRQEHP
jgi:hypothetical protein